MNFTDWFDAHNVGHLAAFLYLNKNGHWPVGFIPLGVEQCPNWHTIITAKMAMQWATTGCNGEVMGMPAWDESTMEYADE